MTERYRRSPHLLVEWEGRRTVLVQCDSMRRFAVDDRVLAVLAQLDAWTLPDEIEVNGRGLEAREWEQLLGMGVVERADATSANGTTNGANNGVSPASQWSAVELAVQRRSNRGGARAPHALAAAGAPPPLFKQLVAGKVTTLPAPDPSLSTAMSDVLSTRRSVRAYAERPLQLRELSTLLHHAARVNGVFRDGDYGDVALHPYPSGGARSELEIYVIASDVEGLAPGAHHYDAREHQLVEMRRRDAHQDRLLRWVHATTGDVLNRDPPAMLLITAVFARVMWKYQGIGLGLVYKDTGGLFQTLYLVATAMGLAPCAIGGGEEAANSRWLGLDPLEESQVGLFLVGPRDHAVAGARAIDGATPAGAASPDRILRMAQGFLPSAMLRAGLRLGVFDDLARGPASAAALAARIGADTRGARILLDGLVASGLVQRDGDDYSLSPVAATFLVSGSATFMGEVVEVYADDVLWEGLRRLPDAVMHGGTALAGEAAGADHPYWARLARAMRAPPDALVASIVAALHAAPGDAQPRRVLDIGCGNGALACAVALRDPAVHVTMLDGAEVVAIARQRAEALGLGGRAHFITGDMTDIALGGPYDLILMSQLLHNLDDDSCGALLRRALEVLTPDGVVGVHDMLRGDSPREDPASHLFSVITLAWTPGGEVRSRAEHEALFHDAGLLLRDAHAVAEAGTWLLVAARGTATG